MLRSIAFALLAVWLMIGPTNAIAERRIALVIGNGKYAEAPLRNPVNDARAMAAALRELDFEVALLENADRHAMQRASLEFGRKLKDDVVGLFYFAGHGMQVRGVNYLIPIGAQVGSEEEVEVEALDVNYILARMASAKNQFNIVILDACRNNPFERSFRSSSSGLAAISAPRGTLIGYATAPGSVAADGQGENGLHTGELVAALKMPNLPLEQTFKRARAEVVTKSGGRQTPWESSSVIGDFMFRQELGAAAPAARPVDAADTTFWNAVKDSSEPADYQAYLAAYPNGVFAVLARSRMEMLSRVRDNEISRVAREAADKAAKEALLKARQTEVANQENQGKPAVLASAPAATAPVIHQGFAEQASEEYVKRNWSKIQKAVREHFDDPDNYWFYNGQIRAGGRAPIKLHTISFYEIVPGDDQSFEIMLLLQGGWPLAQNVYTAGQQPFSILTKYQFVAKGDDLAVATFLPVPRAYLTANRPREN